MLYSCTRMAKVGVKGLTYLFLSLQPYNTIIAHNAYFYFFAPRGAASGDQLPPSVTVASLQSSLHPSSPDLLLMCLAMSS